MASDDKQPAFAAPAQEDGRHSDETSLGKGDILGQEHLDPVLNAKMHMVNNVRRNAAPRRMTDEQHTDTGMYCRPSTKSA